MTKTEDFGCAQCGPDANFALQRSDTGELGLVCKQCGEPRPAPEVARAPALKKAKAKKKA